MSRSRRNTFFQVAVVLVLMILAPARPGIGAEDWCPMSGGGLGQRATCVKEGPCDDAEERDEWVPGGSSSKLTVRLKFIIFCDDAVPPSCAATEADVNAQIDQLRADFDGDYIDFERTGITSVTDLRFHDFCGEGGKVRDHCFCPSKCREECDSEESDMKSAYADDPDQQINIYVVENMRDHTGYGGIGYWPWCDDATGTLGGVIVDGDAFGGDDDCDDNECRALSHELGHNLGLYHTFHGFQEVNGCGCYEGSACPGLNEGVCEDPDCNDVGDYCCDTAASFKTGSCVAGDGTPDRSECGDGAIYNTAFRNHMSYASEECRWWFTDQQYGRMHCWGCSKLPGVINDTFGACCRADGECMDTTQGCCENVGGTFRGASTSCSPTGACCGALGGCEDQVPETCCTLDGGSFLGTETECQGEVHACCLQPEGTCIDTTEACCDEQQGDPYYPNKTCATLGPCPTENK